RPEPRLVVREGNGFPFIGDALSVRPHAGNGGSWSRLSPEAGGLFAGSSRRIKRNARVTAAANGGGSWSVNGWIAPISAPITTTSGTALAPNTTGRAIRR